MLATGSSSTARSVHAWLQFDVRGIADRREPRLGERPARHGERDRARVAREPGAPREPPPPGFTRIGIGDLVGAFLGYGGAHVVTADFAG